MRQKRRLRVLHPALRWTGAAAGCCTSRPLFADPWIPLDTARAWRRLSCAMPGCVPSDICLTAVSISIAQRCLGQVCMRHRRGGTAPHRPDRHTYPVLPLRAGVACCTLKELHGNRAQQGVTWETLIWWLCRDPRRCSAARRPLIEGGRAVSLSGATS